LPETDHAAIGLVGLSPSNPVPEAMGLVGVLTLMLWKTALLFSEPCNSQTASTFRRVKAEKASMRRVKFQA